MVAPRRSIPGVDFQAIRDELEIPRDFPPDVLAQAARAAAEPAMPAADDTALPLVTLDPAASTDLDQAVHIAAEGDGYVVSYAIADVAAFIRPDTALDTECWSRGTTMYSPDIRTPLHPPVLSEAAASLLPDQVRPAVLWQFTLDSTGAVIAHALRRTTVRSIAKLDYASVQANFDGSGAPHPSLALLNEVGERRLQIAQQRHAINLDLPEQEVDQALNGGWMLTYRHQLPCESWNAEISLMTGMVAGQMMIDAGIGILRTLPPADENTIKQLRMTAIALGIDWPDGAHPSDILAQLDRSSPRAFAFIEQSAHLLRGAGYKNFEGQAPSGPEHAGIGAAYAHVTAPLRRLVDRFGNEVCLAIAAGVDVPQWARAALPRLSDAMNAARNRESRLENAVVDTMEALLLADRVGQQFDAVVVDQSKGAVTVVLDDPAVRAKAAGSAAIGEQVQVTLTAANPASHQVSFKL
ncbi:MAG: RNB domain-containing ribonuclease [Antricoccus sp.]